MSAATTDPALVAAPAPDLSPVDAVTQVGHDVSSVDHAGDPVGVSPKERHSLTLDQRRALRRWANNQPIRPSHKACIEWFFSQYGQQISQSTVSHSLSPKYSRLDSDNPQLSGSRLRYGNWPDVEKLVLIWYQQVQASGRQPTNEELGDKAKSIFNQLPRYKDENPPEFSPGWIHRFKKRYGLLIRRQRRHGDGGMNPAEDIGYLAECVPRFMNIASDTSPAAIKEEVLRVVGIEPNLNTCALVRDEVVRRMTDPQPAPPPPPPPIMTHDPPAIPPPQPDQPIYADDDPEVVLQNALRQLQQEEQMAEETAAAVREERERAERAGLQPNSILTTPTARATSVQRYTATPAHDMTANLTLTPITSETPITQDDRPLRCPFCVNTRMLRSIKEAVEHMSTHVVV
ncbi:CENP-B-like protein 1 [Fusarium austroafricanum]|uniref:CENP-B-like protein 1 n=1 Tax=Fusarium austroafricanum TaxID=2364996 RepID=A0A8H4NUR4_9HYPO|nr:CENP-B-like protein 1 [Fusarium austroafricanum]